MLVLPVIGLLGLGLLQVVGVVRDSLIVQDAARAGARAAATSSGDAAVRAAVADATPEIQVRVEVDPQRRTDGDLVTVTVTSERWLGPVRHHVRGRAVARVEPAIGTTPNVPGRPSP